MEPLNSTNHQAVTENADAAPEASPNESHIQHEVSPPASPAPLPRRPVSPDNPPIEVVGRGPGDEITDTDTDADAISPVSLIPADNQSHALQAASPTDLIAPPIAVETSSDQGRGQSTPTSAGAPFERQPPASPVGQGQATRTQESIAEGAIQIASQLSSTTPSPAVEAIPYGNWRPDYLRKSVLFALCCIFLVLLAAVEIIYFVSGSKNGFERANESLSWLWTFSPTIGTYCACDCLSTILCCPLKHYSNDNSRLFVAQSGIPSHAIYTLDEVGTLES